MRLVAALELTGTFRHASRELAQQAFDPGQVRDPLYFDDRRAAAYVKIDTVLHGQIRAGTLRL